MYYTFRLFLGICCTLLTVLSACQPEQDQDQADMNTIQDSRELPQTPYLHISRAQLYDKMLGMLVGSAIGDAMGAPTEMWSRYNIKVEYGFVDSLDNMIREPSPEGTWDFNLPAGGTTDDTRWKILLSDYMIREGKGLYTRNGPDPYAFARYLEDRYESEIAALKSTDSFDPEPFEAKTRRMAWLQEWAVVARPFARKDIEGYSYALSRFYGGEMVCAGLLYTPMIGMAYPGSSEKAYSAAYSLSIFDLGYARDISAITAAMVAHAIDPSATPESILTVLKQTDPEKYFHSRLVGRSSYRFYRDVRYMVHEVREITMADVDVDELKLPFKGRDTLYIAQLQRMYELLDARNQDMPFHAGEIHMINLAALIFGDFDFQKSMEFVINYGRDNDTVGAVTGAILGAYYGKSQLPQQMVAQVLKTNKDKLGIDLEQWASDLTDMLIQHQVIELPAG